MQEGDLAIFLFDGQTVPISVELCLLAQSDPSDARLHQELAPRLSPGRRSMVLVSPDDLASVVEKSQPSADHPIRSFARDLAVERALEEAALGDERPLRFLLRRRGVRISAADAAEARANAERIGRDGENLINASIQGEIVAARLISAEWLSNSDPYAPYDFRVTSVANEASKIEVKSTRGRFENNFHISTAELIEAAQGAERYDLYRLYELNPDGSKLRVAKDIRAFAQAVLSSLSLPTGVRCDSFSVAASTSGLTWEPETYVARPSGDQEEGV